MLKPMLPGRKIKSGLFLLLPIVAGLFAVVLLPPKSLFAAGTVPLGGACQRVEECLNFDNRCGGITCHRNKCRSVICDVGNCQGRGTGGTDTEFHECQNGLFGGDHQYCCSTGWTSQQCANQCSANCAWTQSTCGGRPDWGNLGDGFGPTTCLATEKLEYNDCRGAGARNRVCKNYCECGATTDRAGVACPAVAPTGELTPTPTPAVSVCPWDIIKTGTSNGKIDAVDLAEMNRCYSPLGGVATGCQTSDLNNNGVVNALDYSILLTHWGNCSVAP